MKIQENIKLSDYTTLKTGGTAKYFIEVETQEDLENAVKFSKEKNLHFFIIGEGSDILVSDKDFDVVIIKLNNKEIVFDNEIVTCGAGVIWDDLVELCVSKNLAGIECLSAIPGTVGAAPVQNIGAYGQELKNSLQTVTVYKTDEEKFITLTNGECQFAYRESIFKNPKFKNKYIIFKITLKLAKDAPPNISYQSLKDYLLKNNLNTPDLLSVRNAVIEIRKNKLPNPKLIGNAGSFFKNPLVAKSKADSLRKKFPDLVAFESDGRVKIPAGWLIEKCGWKGKTIGEVGIFENNALVLTNPHGKAQALEIKDLADKIKDSVYEKFKIKLEQEVQDVNF